MGGDRYGSGLQEAVGRILRGAGEHSNVPVAKEVRKQ